MNRRIFQLRKENKTAVCVRTLLHLILTKKKKKKKKNYLLLHFFLFCTFKSISRHTEKKKKRRNSYLPTLIFSGCNLNHTYVFIWPNAKHNNNYSFLPSLPLLLLPRGWLGRAMMLGSFQCRGVLLLWHMVGQGLLCLQQERDAWAVFDNYFNLFYPIFLS